VEVRIKLNKIKNTNLAQNENCLMLKRLAVIHKYNESHSQFVFTKYSSSEDFCKNTKISNMSTVNTSRFSLNPQNRISLFNRQSDVLSKYNKFHSIETEESVKSLDNIVLIHNSLHLIPGEIFLTNYKFVFSPSNPEFFVKEFIIPEYFEIPYPFIVNIIKKKDVKLFHKHTVTFMIRDRPPLILGFLSKKVCEEICNKIMEYTQPKSIEKFFAFNYHDKFELVNDDYENGWKTYNFFLEFIRMGVKTDDPNSEFRFYSQEAHGEISNTYPDFVFIHKNTSDEDLKKIAEFRSKRRFPALIWFSQKNKSSLWRSSQARTGFIDKRNSHDEMFFEHLSKDTEKFHIYDARPFINALANKIKGFGFENSDNYKNCQIFFCDIDNIHKVKQSYLKMQIISQLPL